MTTAHDAAWLSFDGRSESPEDEGAQGARVIAHLQRFVLQCGRRSLAPAGAGLLGKGEQSIAAFFYAAESRPERRFHSSVLVLDQMEALQDLPTTKCSNGSSTTGTSSS